MPGPGVVDTDVGPAVFALRRSNRGAFVRTKVRACTFTRDAAHQSLIRNCSQIAPHGICDDRRGAPLREPPPANL